LSSPKLAPFAALYFFISFSFQVFNKPVFVQNRQTAFASLGFALLC